jgi:hypothetical protein
MAFTETVSLINLEENDQRQPARSIQHTFAEQKDRFPQVTKFWGLR